MTKPTLTPKSFLTTLTIMHLSFFGAMLFFAGMAYYVNQNHAFNFENLDMTYLFILVLIGVFAIFGGHYVKIKQLKKARNYSGLREKLGIYQSASLINYAFVESAAFFGIILYLITSEFSYLLVALILMIHFLTIRPTKEKIIKSLQLGREHQMEFNRENQELN
jgi:hypothetical protein